MQIDPETRIQELGKELPKARRLFRRMGLEIEAHEHLTIAEACEMTGVPFKEFMRTLRAMSPAPDMVHSLEHWSEAPLEALVHHIQERHHALTRQELLRLDQLLNQVLRVHAPNHPELIQIEEHFRNLKTELSDHLDMEEHSLFPSILRHGKHGSSHPPFSTLEELHQIAQSEHESVEDLFQSIAILTKNFTLPKNTNPLVRALYLGLRDLEEDLFTHIYLEVHILFPRAIRGA